MSEKNFKIFILFDLIVFPFHMKICSAYTFMPTKYTLRIKKLVLIRKVQISNKLKYIIITLQSPVVALIIESANLLLGTKDLIICTQSYDTPLK